MYRQFIKPFLDRFIALVALVILSPVFAVIYILVWRNMGRPVFFGQERPGLGGKTFTMYKFRSMTDDQDSKGKLLPDYRRIVPVGNFLRRTSLDELPELINVIKGEMSLVGPRPLLKSYLPRYSPEQFRRHNVRPGITGWAQVNGRNAIDWEKKFELDVWYVDNLSLWLDIKILFLTFWKVFTREGINNQEELPMPEFLGQNELVLSHRVQVNPSSQNS